MSLAELPENLIEHAPAASAVLDADLSIAYVNPAFFRLLGLTTARLTGKKLDLLVHPDDHPGLHEGLNRARSGRSLVTLPSLRFRDKQGSWREMEAVAVGLPGKSAAKSILLQLTEGHEGVQELRQSEERYRAFVEQSSEGVWRLEMDEPIPIALPVEAVVKLIFERSYVAECNSAFARMYGFDQPDQVLGARLHQFLPPDDPGSIEYLTAGVMNGFRLQDVESTEKDRDGRTKYFLNNWVGIIEDGCIRRAWGTQRDITERKLLEEQFRQARKMETAGRLAGGIAHDFNNLLTAILGLSDLLLIDLPPGGSHRTDVEEIKRAAARAAALTKQLLAFSRRQVLQPKVIDLNQVVRNTENMLRRALGEDLSLTTRLAADLGVVRADPGQLDQVIINLAVNARDAMPRGGTLEIGTRNVLIDQPRTGPESIMPPGRYVLLSVADTGIGMTPETQRHLFEPFFTTKEPGKGTGLGLATVYGIVKQSGGFIFGESRLGHGSTFTMYLPEAEGTAEELEFTSPPMPEGRGAGTILLVEDEDAVRRLTKRILEGSGYRVIEARDGAAGIMAAGSHNGTIDMVLTDVVMPGMSGQELSSKMVALRPGIRVLYVSGYAEDAVKEHGKLLPNTAFLQKPFSPAALINKVREVLST